MPELAEVEFYRKQWDPGLNKRLMGVAVHPKARVFRTTSPRLIQTRLKGEKLQSSQAHGKRMLFTFSGGNWLEVHLGMSGRLWVGPSNHVAQRHDHLVLLFKSVALIFTDPRMFGRVHLYTGPDLPEEWRDVPPAVLSDEFTVTHLRKLLCRHRALPIKGALLTQKNFPGVGNWMADEILWQARVHPQLTCVDLDNRSLRRVWRAARKVSQVAMETVGKDDSDLPDGWLFHARWTSKGVCPRHRTQLARAEVAGRVTSWCNRCQPKR